MCHFVVHYHFPHFDCATPYYFHNFWHQLKKLNTWPPNHKQGIWESHFTSQRIHQKPKMDPIPGKITFAKLSKKGTGLFWPLGGSHKMTFWGHLLSSFSFNWEFKKIVINPLQSRTKSVCKKSDNLNLAKCLTPETNWTKPSWTLTAGDECLPCNVQVKAKREAERGGGEEGEVGWLYSWLVGLVERNKSNALIPPAISHWIPLADT